MPFPTNPEYGPYKVHPALAEMPNMTDREYDGLVADIRNHGLRHPITLTADLATIVDGRMRYLACNEALVDPHFKPLPSCFTEEQVLGVIASENLYRDHLDAATLASTDLAYRLCLARDEAAMIKLWEANEHVWTEVHTNAARYRLAQLAAKQ